MPQTVRVVFHIDVNSAYLSWEAVDRLQHGAQLDLRQIPAVVAGRPEERRGIILAKSIPAGRLGIKTGEPLLSARSKCPGLVVLPPRYDVYVRCSGAMLELLEEVSPVVERYSIDEFFIDYTNMEEHLGDPITAAHTIKDRIREELGFTVNVGVSTNKLLAKMASDFTKPDRVHTLFPGEIPGKMWPLPVEDLFMVGRATVPKLYRLGIFTIGDLARSHPDLLQRVLKTQGLSIWYLANGQEKGPFLPEGPATKSIGNSTTVPFDVRDRRTAGMVILSLVEMVAMRLRQAGFFTQLVALSLKTNELLTYSHQKQLATPTDSTRFIYDAALQLLDEMWRGEPLRHLGVRVSRLSREACRQLSFFDAGDLHRQKLLDTAVDRIRQKHGTHKLIRSVFLHSGVKPVAGGVWEGDFGPREGTRCRWL